MEREEAGRAAISDSDLEVDGDGDKRNAGLDAEVLDEEDGSESDGGSSSSDSSEEEEGSDGEEGDDDDAAEQPPRRWSPPQKSWADVMEEYDEEEEERESARAAMPSGAGQLQQGARLQDGVNDSEEEEQHCPGRGEEKDEQQQHHQYQQDGHAHRYVDLTELIGHLRQELAGLEDESTRRLDSLQGQADDMMEGVRELDTRFSTAINEAYRARVDLERYLVGEVKTSKIRVKNLEDKVGELRLDVGRLSQGQLDKEQVLARFEELRVLEARIEDLKCRVKNKIDGLESTISEGAGRVEEQAERHKKLAQRVKIIEEAGKEQAGQFTSMHKTMMGIKNDHKAGLESLKRDTSRRLEGLDIEVASIKKCMGQPKPRVLALEERVNQLQKEMEARESNHKEQIEEQRRLFEKQLEATRRSMEHKIQRALDKYAQKVEDAFNARRLESIREEEEAEEQQQPQQQQPEAEERKQRRQQARVAPPPRRRSSISMPSCLTDLANTVQAFLRSKAAPKAVIIFFLTIMVMVTHRLVGDVHEGPRPRQPALITTNKAGPILGTTGPALKTTIAPAAVKVTKIDPSSSSPADSAVANTMASIITTTSSSTSITSTSVPKEEKEKQVVAMPARPSQETSTEPLEAEALLASRLPSPSTPSTATTTTTTAATTTATTTPLPAAHASTTSSSHQHWPNLGGLVLATPTHADNGGSSHLAATSSGKAPYRTYGTITREDHEDGARPVSMQQQGTRAVTLTVSTARVTLASYVADVEDKGALVDFSGYATCPRPSRLAVGGDGGDGLVARVSHYRWHQQPADRDQQCKGLMQAQPWQQKGQQPVKHGHGTAPAITTATCTGGGEQDEWRLLLSFKRKVLAELFVGRSDLTAQVQLRVGNMLKTSYVDRTTVDGLLLAVLGSSQGGDEQTASRAAVQHLVDLSDVLP